MGAGKTTSAIEYINKCIKSKRFIFITLYLAEAERIIRECNFYTPKAVGGKKLDDFEELIKQGKNVVTTHALLRNFTLETLEYIKAYDYELIIDEACDVIDDYYLTDEDFALLMSHFASVDEKGMLHWDKQYTGAKFRQEMNLCNMQSLYRHKCGKFYWLQSPLIYQSFQNVYIMTYRFESQLQKYYFDFMGLTYAYKNIPCSDKDYKGLIHFAEHESLYKWEDKNAFSKGWYVRQNKKSMQEVKLALNNYFRNLDVCYNPKTGKYRKSASKHNMWTTYKPYKEKLSGKGYAKGFVSCNARATNEYADKNVIAYMCNIYVTPSIKVFFDVDDNEYALTEMLQFLWRSAIRKGEDITVYIPSKRMRGLLTKWLKI